MIPSELILHTRSASLEVVYAEHRFMLPAAYLRAKSPSAENKQQPRYQPDVKLAKVVPVGNYAVQLYFDDGHHTGLYHWDYLRQLCLSMKREIEQLQKQQDETQVLHIQPGSK